MTRNHPRRLRTPGERVGTLAYAALPPPAPDPEDERALVRALRERDETAFESLLDRHYSAMLRLAENYVRSREEAEEVVQDTWLAVLAGLDRFQGRASLKTWIFRILVNRARTRARRESRLLPFSQIERPARTAGSDGEAANPDWLLTSGGDARPTWPAQAWQPVGPEERLLLDELQTRIQAAIQALPRRQREVITLRDVEGWTAEEVCDLLDVSAANQRVLLHRARVRVRDALEGYLASTGAAGSLVAASAR